MPLYTRFRLGRHLSVRPTSKGLRFSVGPRAARVHLGAGSPAVSTGSGPFTYYHRLDGGSSPAGRAARGLSAASKAEQAREIAQALLDATTLHHAEFPPAAPSSAPAPAAPDEDAILHRHTAQALAGISIFRRAQRRAAKAAAQASAAAEVAAACAAAELGARAQQDELDRGWQALLSNDEPAVRAVLAPVFSDNDAPVSVAAVRERTLALQVRVPGPGVLPERMPGVTAAGNVSLRKMTRTQAAELYRLLVAGTVLVTAKEAFAVAPGTESVRITAVRDAEPDVYGRRAQETLVEASLERSALEGVRWREHDAWHILTTVADPLAVRVAGRVQDLVPLVPAEQALG